MQDVRVGIEADYVSSRTLKSLEGTLLFVLKSLTTIAFGTTKRH